MRQKNLLIALYAVRVTIIAGTCPDISLPDGRVSFNRDPTDNGQYPVETIATFTCNPLHSLYGDESTTCETSGSWSHQIPTCTGIEITF